jgi:enoyl-CoA hydratase
MSTIEYETNGHIAYLTLNRPPANAFNHDAYQDLLDATTRVNDDNSVFVAIIKSANERFFSAGNDINEFSGFPAKASGGGDSLDIVDAALSSILASRKPFISLVDGFAVGSGFCVASYSDIVIATPRAQFGIPEVKRGIIGGAPEAAFSLPPKIVRYLALTGDFISGTQAYDIGFAAKLVESNQLLEAGEKVARSLLGNPPLTVQYAKQSLANIFPPEQVAERIEADSGRFQASIATQDFKESVAAFLEKRPPEFKAA